MVKLNQEPGPGVESSDDPVQQPLLAPSPQSSDDGHSDCVMATPAPKPKPSRANLSNENVLEDAQFLDEDGNVFVPRTFGNVPSYGFRLDMKHEFSETWSHVIKPRLKQLPDLLPMCLRYLIWRIFIWLKGREPFIDMFNLKAQQIYGVPIGGIGAGSIGRGFRGQFCRFQMTPGLYTYNVVHANQFIASVRDTTGTRLYQKVLTGNGDPKTLSAWDWTYDPGDGSYLGLYPRAWYTYNIPEENLILKCKQISPIIPNNYKDSCLPAATFVWSVENNGSEPKDVSITFTFKTGTGSKNDRAKKCSSISVEGPNHGVRFHAVALNHLVEGIETTYGIGCLEKPDVTVTHMISFDLKHGSDLWAKLNKTGRLDSESGSYEISKGELGSAVNCAGLVKAQDSLEMIFALVWDQPRVQFKGKKQAFTRRYTRYISRDVQNKEDKESTVAVQNLLGYSLSHFSLWDQAIEDWQDPVLSDPGLPDWFKSALFNELYFVSDGGSVWFEFEPILQKEAKYGPSDVRSEYGRFGYLEGHEYRMYNTYDVHFYSSIALLLLWPKLQLSIQYDFVETIPYEDPRRRIHLADGKRAERKVKDTVPHDLGDPWEDPYSSINAYLVHDISEWKDLNLKFVLQVYRDFKVTGDKVYLHDMLPACGIVMKKSMTWDTDGDGLIENSGSADQTYDSWIMSGPSAYCAGLWLASLAVMIEMLKEDCPLEPHPDIYLYEDILARGTKSYQDKLWTGEYYKFDTSRAAKGKSIMSDQLCGHWFLTMSGLDDSHVFPPSNVSQALKTIYEKNVLGFCNGELGAVNGMNPDGQVDTYAIQSEETWTGVTYALAATMIHNGMLEAGFKTAEGIYRTVYEKIGLGYETPEALYHTKVYRSIGYMRPLSIWAMLHAWNKKKQKQ